MPFPTWSTRRGPFPLYGPQLMGILNATPDSFSDGGGSAPLPVEALVERALAMIDQGASWIDIGGESTRPGSASVSADEELRRILPVVRALREASPVYLSIDTSKASVAQAALEAGADAINDVTALSDPAMPEVVRAFHAGLILMHSRGTPSTMDALADYRQGHVADTLLTELLPRVDLALQAGIDPSAIVLDPGLGFAKNDDQNEELLRFFSILSKPGYPLLVGLSRKRFIGARIAKRLGHPVPPAERDAESARAAAEAAYQGALLLRVHNVAATAEALGERFDVVDSTGTPTGHTVFRPWAHRLGIPHRTSHVWLVRRAPSGEPEILLQKRSAHKDSFPGCFDISSAGHLPAGSDYVSSALRELREELGITAQAEELHPLGIRHIHTESTFHGAPFINDQFSAVFALFCDLPETAFTLQASEVESVHWRNLRSVQSSLSSPTFPNCLSDEELAWLSTFLR